MNYLVDTDWDKLFRPEMSLLEVVIRGTLIYLALCFLMRVVLKRQAGKMSMSDLLVVSIVAGVCRNPLVRDAYSVTDGVSVVVVVLAWGFALDWLSYYLPFVHKLLHPQPVELVRDGEVKKENLRRELMTESQLRTQLREQGVADPGGVASAYLEGSGQVSVIQKQATPGSKDPLPDPPAQGSIAAANGVVPRRVPSPLIQPSRNGQDTASGPDDADIEAFLQASARLQEKITWHEEQIARHHAVVKEVKEKLLAHGVRWKTSESTRTREHSTPPDAQAQALP